jgi:hypothetical protein
VQLVHHILGPLLEFGDGQDVLGGGQLHGGGASKKDT